MVKTLNLVAAEMTALATIVDKIFAILCEANKKADVFKNIGFFCIRHYEQND